MRNVLARLCAGALLISLGGSCSSSGHAARSTSTTSTTALGTTSSALGATSTTQAAPLCNLGVLHTNVVTTKQPLPAGHHLLFFAFTNVGPGGTCALEGYPGVEFRRNDTDPGPMPFSFADHGGAVITSNPPRRVSVGIGQTVFAAIDKQDCTKGNNGLGPIVRVTVPSNPTITELNVPQDFTVTLCDTGDPGNTIDVSPFVSMGRDAVIVR